MNLGAQVSVRRLGGRFARCYDCLEVAKKRFMQIDGVLGVGIGPKQKNNNVDPGNPCLVVYVQKKRWRSDLNPNELIPSEFLGVRTDVIEPGTRLIHAHNDFDAVWLNQGKAKVSVIF